MKNINPFKSYAHICEHLPGPYYRDCHVDLRWVKRTNFVVRLWYGNVPFSNFCRTTKKNFEKNIYISQKTKIKQGFSLLKHEKSFNNNNTLFNS